MSTQSTDVSSDEGSGIRRLEKLQRENRRLRETVSFRLGLHLTSAARKPWKMIILPISFPILCLKIGLERLGKVARTQVLKCFCKLEGTSLFRVLSRMEKRPCPSWAPESPGAFLLDSKASLPRAMWVPK